MNSSNVSRRTDVKNEALWCRTAKGLGCNSISFDVRLYYIGTLSQKAAPFSLATTRLPPGPTVMASAAHTEARKTGSPIAYRPGLIHIVALLRRQAEKYTQKAEMQYEKDYNKQSNLYPALRREICIRRAPYANDLRSRKSGIPRIFETPAPPLRTKQCCQYWTRVHRDRTDWYPDYRIY